MPSIKILHIFIILMLSQDIYGFPKLNFKRRVKILEVRSSFRPGGEIQLYAVLNKYNRTHEAITVNSTISEEFGNKFHLAIEIDIWGDGGWKRNIIFYENDNPCKELKFLFGSIWEEIIHNMNAKCPIQKGFYELKDFYVDISNVPMIFATGLFKGIGVITKNQTFVIKVEAVVEIIALYT